MEIVRREDRQSFDRKLQQQTEYWKIRPEETGKLHADDPEQ